MLLLLACTPDFDESRSELAGFRLVAMAADGPALRALVWSGETWHATAPAVTWTVDEAPAPPFTVAVRVESAAGEVEEGRLDVDTDAEVPEILGFERAESDGAAALAVDVAEGPTTRWMASAGTLVPTGPNAADWEGTGPAVVVALTMDGKGGNAWTWLDVGVDGPALGVDGRWLPTDGSGSGSGRFLATLSAADTGLVLTDLVASDEAGEVVCGLDPFDVAALADGRCGLDDAGGARVALTGEIRP